MKKIWKGIAIGVPCFVFVAAIALLLLILWANGAFGPDPVSFRECEFISDSIETETEGSEFSQYDGFRVVFEIAENEDDDCWGTLQDGQKLEDNVYYRARLFGRTGQTESEIPLHLAGKKGTFILFDYPQPDPGFRIRFDLNGSGKENMIDGLSVVIGKLDGHTTFLTISFTLVED